MQTIMQTYSDVNFYQIKPELHKIFSNKQKYSQLPSVMTIKIIHLYQKIAISVVIIRARVPKPILPTLVQKLKMASKMTKKKRVSNTIQYFRIIPHK